MRLIVRSFFLFTLCCAAQHQDAIDFKNGYATISLGLDSKSIKGSVTYEFEVLKNVDSIFLDAVGMSIHSVKLSGKKLKSKYTGNKVVVRKRFKAGSTYHLKIEYDTKPKQTLYFLGFDDGIDDNEQVWTQGQGKYTSHWLPSLDDMNDKVVFDQRFLLDADLEVVANGKKIAKQATTEGYYEWGFDMLKPMSSYLAAFAIGNFDKKVIHSHSNIPIELYYEPEDSSRFEPTYRYSKVIFDFLEGEIGVAYPWQNYKQVPVHDFLYAGMENTSCTIFSNHYVVDSIAFNDLNYINVNAHELAHQWFGNLVTEKNGEHHWLHEGFATYYAYLAERELFGDDHFYWKLYQTAKTLHQRSERGEGEALMNPKATSLTFYEKGAWALVMLRDELGDKTFRKGIKRFLNSFAFQNATVQDFLEAMEKESGQSLDNFKDIWLVGTAFPWKTVKQFLGEKNASIQSFFSIQQNGLQSEWLTANYPMEMKIALLEEFKDSIPITDFPFLLQDNHLKVRQKAISIIETIPEAYEPYVRSLLQDESYKTQEIALYRLWEAFPEHRAAYLNATKGIIGLPDKNVRLLWLTLALATPDYAPTKKTTFLDELKSYTATHNHFQVRQNAFHYLILLGEIDQVFLKNLIQACGHHVWRFRKSSKNLVKELYTTDSKKTLIKNLEMTLSEKEKTVLKTIIDP